MDGRFEIAEKDWKNVDRLLDDMPDFVEDWVLDLRSSKHSAKTTLDYLFKLKKYFESINNNIIFVSLDDLTGKSIRQYLVSCQTKINVNGEICQTSNSYVNTIWSCLNSFFKFLKAEKYINENPMENIPRPGGSDESRINEHRVLLTKKDFKKITDKAKTMKYYEYNRNRNIAIIYLFMCTGLRESALCSINVNDINYDEWTLFIKDKGDVDHKFKLNEGAIEYISLWLDDREKLLSKADFKTDALFITNKGKRISVDGIVKIVKELTFAALGKELSPHKLRAGVCSILYKETKDIEFVRRFIGHSDVSVTKRYIVTGGNEIEEGREILNSGF